MFENIQGAIFDADGTLLDSMPIWDEATLGYIRSRGGVPDEAFREAVRELSMAEMCAYIKERFAFADSAEDIAAQINKIVEGFYLQTVPAKPGAETFLAALCARGVKLYVATATDLYLIEGALRRTGLLPYFDRIFTCTQVGQGKSKPDIFFAARDHLGTRTAQTFVFEDALYAAKTAKAAGFPVAAIFDAYEPNAPQLAALADGYFTTYDQMLAALE